MNCCKNELGAFPHSKDISTGIMGETSGTYTFEFSNINGTNFQIVVEIKLDDMNPQPIELVIPKGKLNEDLYYCFTVKGPDGEYITANECETFCLKTYILITEGCGDNCP